MLDKLIWRWYFVLNILQTEVANGKVLAAKQIYCSSK